MYTTKTFFEYIGAADMELVHSQVIGWILSDDFQGFVDKDKARREILKQFFGVEDTQIKNIAIEQDSIDLLIECEGTLLSIENKIKSSQHSDQLDKYKEFLEKKYEGREKKYYFLTLVDEQSGNLVWENKSYKQLLETLHNLKKNGHIAGNHFNGQLLSEYMITLEKLIGAIEKFLKDPASCPNVFEDGGKSKSAKVSLHLDCEFQQFIRSNQLETLFQKLYFREVAKLIKAKEHIYVVETNGKAILGHFLFPHKELINGKQFNFGMDFQNGNFKTMCISPNYYKSTKADMPEHIINLFDQIHLKKLEYGYFKKANKPKTRAQVSVTKGLRLADFHALGRSDAQHWWHLTPTEFAKLFDREVDVSRDLIANHLFKELEIEI